MNLMIKLTVIGARDLPLTHSSRSQPNAFVGFTVEGTPENYKTKRHKDRNPTWNEEFDISNVVESTTISLTVWHKPYGFKSEYALVSTHCLTVESLLDRQGESSFVDLQLKDVNSSSPGGILILSIKTSKALDATALALRDAKLSGEKLVESLDKFDTASQMVQIIPSLGPFLEMADQLASVHPSVHIAWQVVSLSIKIPRGQLKRDASILRLISEMEELYSYVTSVYPSKKETILEDTVQAICEQTIECTFFIKGYTKYCFGTRAIIQPLSTMAEKMNKFQDAFTKLKTQFITKSTMHIAIVSSKILGKVEDIRNYQLLERLKPVELPTAGRPSCLDGTREEIIKHIIDWIVNVDHENRLLWLYGLSGTGKSTISTTIADKSRDLRYLAAFIFFNRDVKELSDPIPVVKTLAHNLSLFDPRIGHTVATAIEQFPTLLDAPIRFQFQKLIEEPLRNIESEYFGGPVVIVVDAFDECGNESSRKELLSLIKEHFTKLPSFVRVVLTSRPEKDIERYLGSTCTSITRLELGADSSSTSVDISAYIESQIKLLRAEKPELELPADWSDTEVTVGLVRKASGLFIWASTACSFLRRSHQPARDINVLLGLNVHRSTPFATLDALYATALERAGDWGDEIFSQSCQAVLGLVLVATVPLLPTSINDLLRLEQGCVYFLKYLGSVLRWGDAEPVRILHPSFRDFLSDPRRCNDERWRIDMPLHHSRSAQRCVELMAQNARNSALQCSLSNGISYASTFWIEHVILSNTDHSRMVYDFLSKHLLDWMEMLSKQGKFRLAITGVQQLRKLAIHDSTLSRVLYDTERFAQMFASDCEHSSDNRSTALSFCPQSTTLFELFQHERILHVVGHASSWQALLLQLQGHDNNVTSVAFSPDGSKIVSGSYDKTVRVWDANSGMESAISPLRGHEGRVTSVAFSLDGSKVVSGSNDRTVRVWDANLGMESAISPLRGHERVTSVVFSPDGSKIVCASRDKTIRVWEASSGMESIISPLRGHEGRVTSVAFSLDGSKVVSGSNDRTVRVWDASSGIESTISPLRGHEGVTSVAFSPDGSKIVCGSRDKTVRVWDANSGMESAISPLRGHEDLVECVTFSPDGSKIICGSRDRTVRVWDAGSGMESAISPLSGHEDCVESVAFSPDGSKIVSGSSDMTVRVWDANSGMDSTIFPLRGHEECVVSVAFSPDGSKIVSGSYDKTVRVWDTNSGMESAIFPLRGHEECVVSVAFSPDGSKIVSGSYDKTVRVWDAGSGMESTISPLRGHEDLVESVAFSPDGSKIVSESRDRMVRVWDASTGVQLVVHEGDISDMKEILIPSKDTGLSVSPDNWIIHHSSRRKARLPRAVPLYYLQPHGAMLVGWHKAGHYPLVIQFI